MSCKKCVNKCFENFNYYLTNDNDIFPPLYIEFLSKYRDEGIIAYNDNNKAILTYIINNIVNFDRVCYYDIGFQILKLNDFWNGALRPQIIIQFWMDYLTCAFGDPDSEKNQLLKVVYKNNAKNIKEKYSLANVKVRNNQASFRSELIKIHKRCQMCGIENKELLVASHIKRYESCSDEESADVFNGLLLCSGHDKLYDRGLITFDEQGKIIISKKLSIEDRKLLNINNDIQINLQKENIKYIMWHKDVWFVEMNSVEK